MSMKKAKNLGELVQTVGRYPEEAFLFVRDGLNFTIDREHGSESQAHQLLARFLHEHEMDWDDLVTRYHAGELDDLVVQAIDAAGGCENLNRHVGGRELCWGLRDYALNRWGLLARTVLESWKVRATKDFGKIVFAFIEQDLMQRQDGDSPQDFEDVYSFEEAFSKAMRLGGGGEEDGISRN